jgi:hypothetical protein
MKNTKCVFHFSLLILFHKFFTSVNIQQIRDFIRAKMHINLQESVLNCCPTLIDTGKKMFIKPARIKCNKSIRSVNLGLLRQLRRDDDNRRFFVTSVQNVPKILLKGAAVPVHGINVYGWLTVQLHSLLNSASHRGVWSASRPSRFTFGNRAPGPRSTGGWVGPTDCLDALMRKVFRPCREWNTSTCTFWKLILNRSRIEQCFRNSFCSRAPFGF